jgi:phosphoribosylaminoimidazole-succinocarboxamide synthase
MSPSAPPAAAAAATARVTTPAKTLIWAPSSPHPSRFPYISMSTSSSPRAPPLTAAAPSLLAADPGHREAVLLAAHAAMGNCLGETRLDLAVPGLRLAAKGKVSKQLAPVVVLRLSSRLVPASNLWSLVRRSGTCTRAGSTWCW